jgi:ABC-2 type transport system ATP-binding protein
MTAIETTGLGKRFGEVEALTGLDLTVETGEIYGFLGPNGAGKSTTINILLGFLDPTTGHGSVLGQDVVTESVAIRERTGILPEGFDVYERLTAREHVRYAAEIKRAEEDPDALLDRVGLEESAWERAAGGFSTGMTQRLALAMALVGDPDLLILDEPSSGLDPRGMQEMRSIIREEAAAGTTVFFSSHILSEVEAVCDRVGIMRAGELVAVDTIDGLRESAGDGASVALEVSAVPEDVETLLGDIPGVMVVRVDGETVTVEVDRPRAKVDAIVTLDGQTTVEDVTTADASLEELFNSLTADPAEGSP